MNSSCVNATNCQLSVNTSECNGEPHAGVLGSGLQTEFNGLPVVFSPINVNYNGKCFVYILDSLGLTQCRALKFEFETPCGP